MYDEKTYIRDFCPVIPDTEAKPSKSHMVAKGNIMIQMRIRRDK